MKKGNKYKITLEQIDFLDKEATLKEPISFDFMNHDEIFKIIEIINAKNPFEEENQATEFALGLKLFTEVILKNKNNPLFEELSPAMLNFMMKLKSTLK